MAYYLKPSKISRKIFWNERLLKYETFKIVPPYTEVHVVNEYLNYIIVAFKDLDHSLKYFKTQYSCLLYGKEELKIYKRKKVIKSLT